MGPTASMCSSTPWPTAAPCPLVGGPKRGPRVETLVLIDAAALRRGTTAGEETCEIEGIGPVCVDAATELLGEGALRYIVKEGFDIKTVTRSTRAIAKAVDAALVVRDRTCVVPGCGRRLGLERDHVFVDYGDDGPTELANLVRLCPEHHALKTFGGWRLEGRARELHLGRPGPSEECGRHLTGPQGGHGQGEGRRDQGPQQAPADVMVTGRAQREEVAPMRSAVDSADQRIQSSFHHCLTIDPDRPRPNGAAVGGSTVRRRGARGRVPGQRRCRDGPTASVRVRSLAPPPPLRRPR